MTVPISALPLGIALDGTEQVPMVQAGLTVRVPSAALVGASGPPGAPGPPGPTGPTGPIGPTGPAWGAAVQALSGLMNVLDSTDVGLIDGAAGPNSLTLPLIAGTRVRVLVLKFVTAPNAFSTVLYTTGADVFEDGSNNEFFSGLVTLPCWFLFPDTSLGQWLFLARSNAP